jgi:RimJ/RimL family protein N-acetyltransferase
MKDQLFTRDLVCLAPLDPESDAPVEAEWRQDAAFVRAFGDSYVRPSSVAEIKKEYETIEKEADESHGDFHFAVRTCEADRLVGFARLEGVDWSHGAARIRIGIGAPVDRGQGYGSQVLAMLLVYAFDELNLYRLTVLVPAYNAGALRFFQRVGFTEEVRRRQALSRGGSRWDFLHLGLLREGWERNENG